MSTRPNQLKDRQRLQTEIKAVRTKHARALRELHFDTANYRLMKRGETPKPKSAFDRLEAMREKSRGELTRQRFDRLKEQKPAANPQRNSNKDRLRKLREMQNGKSDHGPELER